MVRTCLSSSLLLRVTVQETISSMPKVESEALQGYLKPGWHRLLAFFNTTFFKCFGSPLLERGHHDFFLKSVGHSVFLLSVTVII